jgi:hypothetical protein
MAGSLSPVKLLLGPNEELLSSVVRRISGKTANRTNGTDTNAPTSAEPTPMSAAKNERRLRCPDSAAAGADSGELLRQSHIVFGSCETRNRSAHVISKYETRQHEHGIVSGCVAPGRIIIILPTIEPLVSGVLQG